MGLRQALPMTIAPALRETLVKVAEVMAPAQHEWWIIASAAVALHGADPGAIGDVDVLLDPRDAGAVLAGLAVASPGAADAKFRSELFARWHGAPLPVEFFAGFHLREHGHWTEIRPATRQAVQLDEATLFVPERAELKAMLLRFGRPKDLARAALL
jgi:hypothetical protein